MNINELKIKVEDKLLEIGLDPSILGFKYINDAVIYCLLHCINVADISITKVLYPEIAKMNNTSASRIERCIRTCIEKAFANTPNFPEALISGASGKAANSTFLAYVVLMMQREI